MVQFAFKLSIHGQLVTTKFSDLIGLAVHAEELGYEGVSVVDHLFLPATRLAGYSNAPLDKPYFLDAWTALGAVGQATRSVHVGPQVTPIGLRHPVWVAKAATALDHITDGRLLLQLGAGHQKVEYDGGGFRFPKLAHRIEGLREGIDIIRRLWLSDEPVDFTGEHYRLEGMQLWPKPVQALPEIWLGGTSESIRSLAGEVADGWSPAAPQHTGLDPVFYRDSLQEMKERALERSTPHFTGGALFFCVLGEQDEIAPTLQKLRQRVDWAELTTAELRDAGIALAGSPGQVAEAISRYIEAGVEYFSLAFIPLDNIAGVRGTMETFREAVMSEFVEG